VSFLPMPVDLSTEHILLWISTNSQMELPVRVQSTDQGLWPLLVQGPARRIQRRQFVRVPVRLPGQLTRTDLEPTDDAEAEAEPHQWPVTILDISEGGVCCLLAELAPPPPAGSAVEISFPSADGELLLVSGVIIRHLQPPGKQTTTAVSLAIRFDDPNQHGDAVRHLVFAEQLRQRQVRLVT
jgi:c-di-GMP-binding flagellar brake protein YcgR